MTERLPMPHWRGERSDRARVVETIDAWITSDALRSVVLASGGDLGSRTGAHALDYLDQFSSEHWDFRRGRERDGVDVDAVDVEIGAVVDAAASSLGQSGRTEPRLTSYGSIVMTGGMVRAGIVKPRFAASLLASGIQASEIVFLGAHRPFSAAESSIARSLGVDGDDEVDAMVAGMRAAFDLGGVTERRSTGGVGAGSWSTVAWEVGPTTYLVEAAPSPDPTRRADTAATFRHWGSTKTAGQSALVVTTPIYVPYQAAVATECLGIECGLTIDTVGTDDAAQDLGDATQRFSPTHRVQELRSAVGAMRSLRAAASSLRP